MKVNVSSAIARVLKQENVESKKGPFKKGGFKKGKSKPKSKSKRKGPDGPTMAAIKQLLRELKIKGKARPRLANKIHDLIEAAM